MRLTYLLMILCLVSASLKGADDPKAKKITILQPGDIQLDVQDKQSQVPIPIKLDDTLKNKAIKVSVVSVKRDNIIYPFLRNNFDFKIQESTLILSYSPNKLLKVGKYELLLQVKEETTKFLDHLTLSVVYPEGTLSAPASLTMSLTSYGIKDQTNEAPPLLLSETGGIAGISNLELPGLSFSGDCTVHREIQFLPGIISLSPKQTTAVRYRVKGDFPLGTSQATYSLSTPGNQASIRVEVHNRLWKAFILLAIAAGIGVGFWLRKVIVPRKTRASYQLQGLRLIQQLQQARSLNPDAVFKQKCEDIEKTVYKAVDGLTIDPLSDENNLFTAFDATIGQASSDLQTALQDLQQRRDALQADTKSLGDTLSTPYQLPPVVIDQLGNAQQQMKPIMNALRDGLFSEGQEKLNKLLESIRSELNKPLQAYVKKREAFARLEKSANLPQELLATLGVAIDWVNQTPFQLLQINTSIGDLSNDLGNWSMDYSGWHGEVLGFADALKTYFLDVLMVLNGLNPKPEGLKGLYDSIVSYMGFLTDDTRYTDPHRFVLNREELHEFAQNWYQFFASMNDQTTEFKACFEVLDYKCAARKMISRSKLGQNEETGQSLTLPDFYVSIPGSSLLEGRAFGTVTAASITASIQTITNEQKKLEWLEALISWLLICLLGYQLYEKTFVGTWNELIAIFFWGFGLDVTASSLTDIVKKAIKT